MTGLTSRIKEKATVGNWFLGAVLLVGLAAAAPLFFDSGLPNLRGGGDSPFLLQRLHQLTTALADGHFPVRWMPDSNYGYGYPFYNYYAALSIYVAALFRFLGASFVLAIKLSQLAGFLVAAWSMYVLGRRWLGSGWAGLLSAAAYTLAPFHMVNVYVRGDSLAEFWAMALYPLALLAADRLAQVMLGPLPTSSGQDKARRMALALLAVVYAALVLSHNISAMIFTPFLLFYMVLRIWIEPGGTEEYQGEEHGVDSTSRKQKRRKSRAVYVLWAFFALALALALAAWFWMPALAESSFAQLDPVTEGYFHYNNHFRSMDLVQRTFLFNYDTVGGRVFSMGLVQAVMVLLGAVALIAFGRRPPNSVSRGRQIYVIAGLLLSTFMITSWSAALWDNLPLLSFTQFPWRFLSIQALFGSLAAGGLALLPGRRGLVVFTVALLLVTGLGDLRLDFLSLTDADVTAERLAQYEWYTGNIGTTVSAEYLPDSVQPRPQTSQWLNHGERYSVGTLAGDVLEAQITDLKTAEQAWRIVAGEEGATISLPTLAWPGWRATVDGNDVEVEVAGGTGLIGLTIPPGEHLVELRLGRTPVRIAGELAALTSLVAIIWLLASSGRWTPKRRILYPIAGLLVLAAALRLLPETDWQENDLNWDFAQMAYLHHARDGVLYENGARLASYSYSSDEVTAGETLVVTLDWDNDAPEPARVSLTTPASNRNQWAPQFADQVQPIRKGSGRYELAIPENAPSGLVIPQLTVLGTDPLTASDQQRGDIYLRPVLLRDKPQQAEPGEDSLDARIWQVKARDDAVIDVQLQWLTRQPLTENYNYSLRLVDGSGVDLVQLDGQPGSGFLPSSDWPAGQWVDDWIAMTLPSDLQTTALAGPYGLVVRLYDVESSDPALTRLLGQLEWREGSLHFTPNQPSFSLPAEARPFEADVGQAIALAGYTFDQRDNLLHLTLYWFSESAASEDLYHFVHVESSDGMLVAQHDGMPRYNTYPTSQWLEGEIIADPLRIDTSQLPDGEYKVYVGLYRLKDGQADRIPISGSRDQTVVDRRLQLPEKVLIQH